MVTRLSAYAVEHSTNMPYKMSSWSACFSSLGPPAHV